MLLLCEIAGGKIDVEKFLVKKIQDYLGKYLAIKSAEVLSLREIP